MCWFHKWDIIGANHHHVTKDTVECINYYDFISTKDVYYTLVLQKCSKCGNHRTLTLDGTWSYEQLIGKK
jgi:hypothetical protein